MEDKQTEQNNTAADKDLKEKIEHAFSDYIDLKTRQKNTPAQASAAATASGPEIKAEPVPEAQPATHGPIIRTYKSDMEDTIEGGHLSSINIAVSENNKLMRQMTSSLEAKKKIRINKTTLIISLVLIIGGALAIGIPSLLVKKQSNPTQPVVQSSFAPLIPTDQEQVVNIDTLNLSRLATTLNEDVNQSATSLGQIKDFVLVQASGTVQTPITSTQFLSLIGANVPSEISLNLEPQFMFGMHNFDGNQEFLILTIDSYNSAFAGMLEWEPNLWQDFTALFGLPDDTNTPAANATSSMDSSTTPVSSNAINPFLVEVKQFEDESFYNENCRVVTDASGNIIFLYSIVNNNTIIITTNVNTLKEILSRMSTENNTVTQ